MRKLYVILTAIILFILFYSFETLFEKEIEQWFQQPVDSNEVQEEKIEYVENTLPTSEVKRDEAENFTALIGLPTVEVISQYGEPARKDKSAYGYDWWIYSLDEEGFLQVGIQSDLVVTVFMAGKTNEHIFLNDETYDKLNTIYSFQNLVNVETSEGAYQFKLSSEEVKMRPLIKKDNNWVQFNFDTVTDTLSSVRVMTTDILLLQRPYSISYRGELRENPILTAKQWSEIEKGDAKQIFDFTNFIRNRHGLQALEWEEKVATIAYLHSQDMSKENYFAHSSPLFGELQDRFEKGDVRFKSAGENIAAQYVDGLAAVEGWLNSEGHRVNLLHEEFTHLGVGVYQDYYTQNFMTSWQVSKRAREHPLQM